MDKGMVMVPRKILAALVKKPGESIDWSYQESWCIHCGATVNEGKRTKHNPECPVAIARQALKATQ